MTTGVEVVTVTAGAVDCAQEDGQGLSERAEWGLCLPGVEANAPLPSRTLSWSRRSSRTLPSLAGPRTRSTFGEAKRGRGLGGEPDGGAGARRSRARKGGDLLRGVAQPCKGQAARSRAVTEGASCPQSSSEQGSREPAASASPAFSDESRTRVSSGTPRHIIRPDSHTLPPSSIAHSRCAPACSSRSAYLQPLLFAQHALACASSPLPSIARTNESEAPRHSPLGSRYDLARPSPPGDRCVPGTRRKTSSRPKGTPPAGPARLPPASVGTGTCGESSRCLACAEAVSMRHRVLASQPVRWGTVHRHDARQRRQGKAGRSRRADSGRFCRLSMRPQMPDARLVFTEVQQWLAGIPIPTRRARSGRWNTGWVWLSCQRAGIAGPKHLCTCTHASSMAPAVVCHGVSYAGPALQTHGEEPWAEELNVLQRSGEFERTQAGKQVLDAEAASCTRSCSI